MRRIFSSSFIRFTRVCNRPAVSMRIGSRPFALPDEIASKTTAAGSAPACARIKSTPARRAQTSSCSTAAARNVSAAQMSGFSPWRLRRFASLPTVVVLPVPLTPTIRVTLGWVVTATRPSTAANTAWISSLTRSRRLDVRESFFRTAAMIRSVAATPISAEINSSSSASRVATSTGRESRSGSSARRMISSNRLTISCLVRERLSRMRPITFTVMCFLLRPAGAGP